ncbi:MAG: glutamate--tRNA ligase, partial [Abditibacteriota bacterium]|nr:glutamate--tRNA ligase [Abditibacteriota bacterium]
LEQISNHPAIFDLMKLKDLNGEYIRMKTLEELRDCIRPYLEKAGFIGAALSLEEEEYLLEVTRLIQDRLVTLSDAVELSEFFYRDIAEYEPKGLKHFRKDNFRQIAGRITEALEGVEPWTQENVETAVRGVAEELGLKPAEVIHPTRMAVTGRTWGPGLFEIMQLLGKEKTVSRYKAAMEYKADQE